ncbi:hypothetical protein [Snuella lapsa]|uniref:Uncharacterized protein n=1 Tax=Snuella lapsa TaxID=870481 RepID=A0ABP6Y0D5_9FLAO
MNTKIKFIAALLIFTLFNCKQKTTLSEYKYADKNTVLNCEDAKSKLYNEALFSFENDILNFYGKNNNKQSLTTAYAQFIRNTQYNRVKFNELVSEHSLEIFNVLKEDTSLWQVGNTQSNLNYYSPLFKCIASNIENKDLKTTLNALLDTHSMSQKLFAPPLQSNYRFAIKDKYLAAYIAFDLFYAKLFDVDLTVVKTQSQSVDFNKKPTK